MYIHLIKGFLHRHGTSTYFGVIVSREHVFQLVSIERGPRYQPSAPGPGAVALHPFSFVQSIVHVEMVYFLIYESGISNQCWKVETEKIPFCESCSRSRKIVTEKIHFVIHSA
jgi:hypothetical protein